MDLETLSRNKTKKIEKHQKMFSVNFWHSPLATSIGGLLHPSNHHPLPGRTNQNIFEKSRQNKKRNSAGLYYRLG
jgi:hypothetical protein